MNPLVITPRKISRPLIPFNRIDRFRHDTAEAYRDGLISSSTPNHIRRDLMNAASNPQTRIDKTIDVLATIVDRVCRKSRHQASK